MGIINYLQKNCHNIEKKIIQDTFNLVLEELIAGMKLNHDLKIELSKYIPQLFLRQFHDRIRTNGILFFNEEFI